MLKRCEECGYEYSSKASACPKCAAPNEDHIVEGYRQYHNKTQFEGVIDSILAFILALIFYYIDIKFFKTNVNNTFRFTICSLLAGSIFMFKAGFIGSIVVLCILGFVLDWFLNFLHIPFAITNFIEKIFLMIPLFFYIHPSFYSII